MMNTPIYNLNSILNLPFLSDSEREVAQVFAAITKGESNWSSLLVELEQREELSLVYPCILQRLLADFPLPKSPIELEVQLRLLVVILQKMGKYWNSYREEEPLDAQQVMQEFSATSVQELGEREIGKQIWFHLVHRLLDSREAISKVTTLNLIQKGMMQEICMIIDMLEPQERTVFPANQQWEGQALVLRKIESKDAETLQKYFTPAIGQYLSIDSFAHPVLVKEYIRQSQLEMQQGTCLVLMAFESETQDFIGCLTLNDINQYSVEIGLWVSENQQGKGYGSALLNQAVQIIAESIPTQQIIYTVEKENQKSIALCEKRGFQFEKELILEPTPLKNQYREMLRYTLNTASKK